MKNYLLTLSLVLCFFILKGQGFQTVTSTVPSTSGSFTAPSGTLISNSNDHSVTNAIYCPPGVESYMQIFDLKNDFGINSNFAFHSVEFAVIPNITTSTNNGTINFYLLNGVMNTSNLTLLHSQSIVFINSSALETYPLTSTVVVPKGETLVIEIIDYADVNEYHAVGGNYTVGYKPSYMFSSSCGLAQPTTMDLVGFPNFNFAINLYGAPAVPFNYAYVLVLFGLIAVGFMVRKRFF